MSSRLSGLHRQSIQHRIDALAASGLLSDQDAERLRQGRQVLLPAAADRLVENVIGTLALPFAIAPNFVVNGRDCLIPMVIEEPSVVAALSNAGRIAREGGGFEVRCDEYLVTGQIHLTDLDNASAAREQLLSARDALIQQANQVHPSLIARGGGVTDLDVRLLSLADGRELVTVHVFMNSVDAMGANLVNTVCESLAPDIVARVGGSVAMRILSNLSDRSLFTASVTIPLSALAMTDFAAEAVRDRIVLASDVAAADPYRAATHNKGIMNGIDGVALATGNDWRAIEAGAHAYAGLGDGYQPLATWSVGDDGALVGTLTVPLRVGTVGGTVTANPGASLGLRIAGVDGAKALGEIMAAVGLAQNFAALRALATHGIQEGHMRMHGRQHARDDSVSVIDQMPGRAAAKVILLGEHAAVYGHPVVALPIPDAVGAEVSASEGPLRVLIPDWQIDVTGLGAPAGDLLAPIFKAFDVEPTGLTITVRSRVPRAMGVGSSAALAVAVTRAMAAHLGQTVDNETVNRIAFDCECVAHGSPSGVDNTLATYAEPLFVQNDGELRMEPLSLEAPPPVVVAFSGQMGSTREQVDAVRARRELSPAAYDALFEQMGALSSSAVPRLREGDYAGLGALMNVCHGLLTAIEVSTPELESMVQIARSAGAIGAKLTGGGGGGSIVALCPDPVDDVVAAFAESGYKTLVLAGDS